MVGIGIAAHPVMVIAYARQRFDRVAPNSFKTHTLTWRMEVRLKANDLGVVFKHSVGVELLISGVALDADVYAITQTDKRILVFRLVIFVVEAEAHFEVTGRVAAIRV